MYMYKHVIVKSVSLLLMALKTSTCTPEIFNLKIFFSKKMSQCLKIGSWRIKIYILERVLNALLPKKLELVNWQDLYLHIFKFANYFTLCSHLNNEKEPYSLLILFIL